MGKDENDPDNPEEDGIFTQYDFEEEERGKDDNIRPEEDGPDNMEKKSGE